MQYATRSHTIMGCLLFISVLCLGSVFTVDAGEANGTARKQITELLIADHVAMGDYQPFWKTSVQVNRHQLRHATYAALEFVAVHVWEGTSSNLIVNGRDYVLPISEPLNAADLPLRGRSVIPIPVAALREGENVIAIQAGPIDHPTNLFDDFDVASLTLVLN